jgi:hypothetical protein
MRLQRLTATAAVLLAITMATPVVFAQGGGGDRHPSGGSGDRSARARPSGNQDRGSRSESARSGGGERRSEARDRSAGGNEGNRGGSNRDSGFLGSRGSNNGGDRGGNGSGSDRVGGFIGSRGNNNGNDRGGNPRDGGFFGSRSNDANRSGSINRNERGRAVPRSNAPRFDTRGRDDRWRNDNRGYYDRNWRYGYRDYGYRDYGWRRHYGSSWWRSTLRFALGLSIFADDPYYYTFNYGWRPGFDYRYSMQRGISYGGLAFDIEPANAEVYIDGQFTGIAGEFGGQPVPVAPGYHRVELYAPGYDPAALDIRVMPGQVVPYRGTLYPSGRNYENDGYYDNGSRNYGYYERY